MERQKGYSIITNFGCETDCKYCIWKQHSLYGTKTADDYLDKVTSFIQNCKADKLSISGGGDPLNNFNQQYDFWTMVYGTCLLTGKKVDIHTSYIDWNDIYKLERQCSIVNRMVLHSNYDKIFKQLEFLKDKFLYVFHKLRINFVIDNTVTIKQLEEIEMIVKIVNVRCPVELQLAYREYVGKEKVSNEVTDFCMGIQERYEHGKYVKQDDYNIYLFPDGNIYDKYLF